MTKTLSQLRRENLSFHVMRNEWRMHCVRMRVSICAECAIPWPLTSFSIFLSLFNLCRFFFYFCTWRMPVGEWERNKKVIYGDFFLYMMMLWRCSSNDMMFSLLSHRDLCLLTCKIKRQLSFQLVSIFGKDSEMVSQFPIVIEAAPACESSLVSTTEFFCEFDEVWTSVLHYWGSQTCMSPSSISKYCRHSGTIRITSAALQLTD